METLPPNILSQIDTAVSHYEANRWKFEGDIETIKSRLLRDPILTKLIHSLKWRTKDPSHLRDKLERKACEALAAGETFEIKAETVFATVHDLAGVRLLHLHTKQIEQIHPRLMQLFDEEKYCQPYVAEAKTWELEHELMFKTIGINVKRDESLYTSIHYKIRLNSTIDRTCELQVRTLADEIWGEVSHTINYPHPTESVACKEQLKALARVVSGCPRLVDSIVASHKEHNGRSISS